MAFVEQVCSRRPRRAGRLSPGAVTALRNAYQHYVPGLRVAESEAQGLERRLAGLVNQAYGLTEEEVALMWPFGGAAEDAGGGPPCKLPAAFVPPCGILSTKRLSEGSLT